MALLMQGRGGALRTTPEVFHPYGAAYRWANLYPLAPVGHSGNPSGALREAQDPHVVELQRAKLDMIGARTVVAFVGPYWWPAGSDPFFAPLRRAGRPMSFAGVIDGRRWVVGWHPKGASLRGPGPIVDAELIEASLGRLARVSG